jgi:hypothetical protein
MSTPVSTAVERWVQAARDAGFGLWISSREKSPRVKKVACAWPETAALYSRGEPLRRPSSLQSSSEANFSAERTPAKAPAWVPGAHGDPGRARHPEAPPGQGTQASLRLALS